MDRELLNGNPKCTIIENFKGEVIVVRPGERWEFESLRSAMKFVAKKRWEVNISFIAGMESMREKRESEAEKK